MNIEQVLKLYVSSFWTSIPKFKEEFVGRIKNQSDLYNIIKKNYNN